MRILFYLSFILVFNFNSLGQICGTDEYNEPFIKNNPQKYIQIEENIQNYLTNTLPKSGHNIVIPVVFHIVWINNDQNLPDSVIHQQLKVLNNIFQLKNSDTILLTDTLKNWKGNFNIEFELAYIDPDGLPTSGITRKRTINPQFSYWNDPVKKPAYGIVPWPTTKYLNIWICDLTEGLMGYSQFPGGPHFVDGVVIDWQTVGDQIYPWTYEINHKWARGKILVHEIGHWLNLFHPWGNGFFGCGEDHIPEIALQPGPIYPGQACPDTMFSSCADSGRLFIKHYMDYSGSDCQVCFTKNQVLRGLASLNIYRTEMVENYQPRPTIDNFSDIKINPTLTKGKVYIELPPFESVVNIKVYDIKGRIIKNISTLQRFNELHLHNPPGVYLIDIYHNQNKIFNQKIIISPASSYGGR